MIKMLNEFLFQLVLFLSNTVQVITGFAGTLLALPFGIKLVGMEQSKAVLSIFTMLACGDIAIQHRWYIVRKELARIVIVMTVGMAVGTWLCSQISMNMLLYLYAVIIVAVACKKLFWKKEMELPQWFLFLVLFAAGIIHGMFLSGGALLVIYASAVLKNKDEFHATIAPVWVILNAILAVGYARQGYYDAQCIASVAISIVPLVASIFLGNHFYHQIDQAHFQKFTSLLLLISGVSLLV